MSGATEGGFRRESDGEAGSIGAGAKTKRESRDGTRSVADRRCRPGGLVEVDVPNAVSFRNRSRILRGKNITFDYEDHYLYAQPVLYRGFTFYPARHNREFTLKELVILLKAAKFDRIDAYFLKSRRHREGWERIRSLGSALRDLVPSLRKSIIAFAEK